MDPNHRHELEENDLLSFLTNFRQFWAKNGTVIMLGVALVTGGWAIKRYIDSRNYENRENAWGDLSQASSPVAISAMAQDYDSPGYQARAYLQAADLALQQSFQAPDLPASSQPAVTSQPSMTRSQLLEQAQGLYQQILQVPQVHLVYRLNAMLGLAAIAENRSQADAAGELYKKVIQEAGTAYPAITAQAQSRSAILHRVTKVVPFATEPLPSNGPSLLDSLPADIPSVLP